MTVGTGYNMVDRHEYGGFIALFMKDITKLRLRHDSEARPSVYAASCVCFTPKQILEPCSLVRVSPLFVYCVYRWLVHYLFDVSRSSPGQWVRDPLCLSDK